MLISAYFRPFSFSNFLTAPVSLQLDLEKKVTRPLSCANSLNPQPSFSRPRPSFPSSFARTTTRTPERLNSVIPPPPPPRLGLTTSFNDSLLEIAADRLFLLSRR
uniref:Uncharacterized protein n=1 Tax=Opuntia streptacantha TaxID=393608 RepID=A0A7C9EWP5_OPUST